MKNMKHGGKARKTHKRMMDGGMVAQPAVMTRPVEYSKGSMMAQPSVTTRPVGTAMSKVPAVNPAYATTRPVMVGKGSPASTVAAAQTFRKGGSVKRKRMADGGMADYGEAAQPMAYTKGKVGTPAYRPVGRPGFIPSPGIGGNLKPGMRPLASSDAYMRRPPRGGGMSAVEQGLGLQGRGGLTPTQNALADVAGGLSGAGIGYRKGGAVKRKRMADGGMAYTKGKVGTPAHRPIAGSPFSKGKLGTPAHRPVAGGPFSKGKVGTPAHRPVAGGPAGPRAMRGGGLARKGVGMALAKGGLAKRAGGCAKRGVGRGKTV